MQQLHTAIEADDSRKDYSKPQLVDYGSIAGLTQGGGMPWPIEDVMYSMMSV